MQRAGDARERSVDVRLPLTPAEGDLRRSLAQPVEDDAHRETRCRGGDARERMRLVVAALARSPPMQRHRHDRVETDPASEVRREA